MLTNRPCYSACPMARTPTNNLERDRQLGAQGTRCTRFRLAYASTLHTVLTSSLKRTSLPWNANAVHIVYTFVVYIIGDEFQEPRINVIHKRGAQLKLGCSCNAKCYISGDTWVAMSINSHWKYKRLSQTHGCLGWHTTDHLRRGELWASGIVNTILVRTLSK